MVEKGMPIFLIAGGPGARTQKGPDPLLQAVFRQTGAPRPTIAYVGAASGDDAEFRLFNAGRFERAGAGPVMLAPLCGKGGDAETARAVIEMSDLVFLSGGDVDAGMGVLKRKKMIDFLGGLYRKGKPFFGISAGSIMLARQWIRWRNPEDEASAELFNCLGFAPVYCDTHGEAEGWEELKAFAALSPDGTIGHGIPSGAAIVVGPNGAVSALGGEVHRFRKQARGVVQIESLFPSGTP
jgi:peptidase E